MDYKIILIVVIAVVIGLASRFIFKMAPNNFVEKEAETIIKDETGKDIDLEQIVDCTEDLPTDQKKE